MVFLLWHLQLYIQQLGRKNKDPFRLVLALLLKTYKMIMKKLYLLLLTVGLSNSAMAQENYETKPSTHTEGLERGKCDKGYERRAITWQPE